MSRPPTSHYRPARHHARRTGRMGRSLPTLSMASMIDVVFLLLIFFLLTVNFRAREGYLPSRLPAQSDTPALSSPIDPLNIYLTGNGPEPCHVQIGTDVSMTLKGTEPYTVLAQKLQAVLTQQRRTMNDPLRLVPSGDCRWDDLVRVYNTLWAMGAENIIFARPLAVEGSFVMHQ